MSAKKESKKAAPKSTKKATGLGRGFDSLIPTDIITENFANLDDEHSRPVLIEDIRPNPDQPRRDFSPEQLAELVDSIRQHGVLQPVVVVREETGFRLVAGERRWRAAKLAGLEEIPAIVRSLDELQQLEIALIENLQREDLSPLEQAAAFYRLHQQFNMAMEKIAERVGKASTTVSNVVRLLKLPDPAKRALHEGKISEGHARAILSLTDEQKQQELLDYILRYNWTVRQAEQFASAVKAGANTGAKAVKRTKVTTEETEALAKFLKRPVEIRNMARGGRLIIEYKDDSDLKRITKKLID